MSNKFQVGDRVLCIYDKPISLSQNINVVKGEIYTVEKIVSGDRILVEDTDGTYDVDRFNLVSKAEPETAEFVVDWAKTYVASGRVIVRATDEDAAHVKVSEEIGDYSGSMQYIADDDHIEVVCRVSV